MIKKLTLKNFKSFRESTIELGPLSIILGANASGKSNFVDALRFLQGSARLLSLTEIFSGSWAGGQQVWIPIRGGEREAFNLLQQTKRFELKIECELPTMEERSIGNFDIAVELANDALHIARERLAVNEERFISEGEGRGDTSSLAMIYYAGYSTRTKEWAVNLRNWLSEIYFPSFTPPLMRDYVSTRLSELGLRGENLSSILFRLTSDPKQRQTLLEWLRELCPQEIVDFDFIKTQLGDVLLAVKEPNGVTISARSMSDGTLRFLATVVALLHAKEGSLFVLEDIDSDLHPSRLHLLVSFLEQVTASRKIQVIATSHSPYLLDHLSEQSLASVLVFARDHESQCTKVSKLVDIPGFAEARQHNPLDLLHASGWMEQNL